MFDRLRHFFRRQPSLLEQQAAELRLQNEVRRLKAEQRLMEGLDCWTGPFVDPNTPLYDDPDFYQAIGYGEAIPWNYDNRGRGEAIPIYLTEYGLKVIRDASRRACNESVFAINAVENRISYICGKGFQYDLVDVKPDHEAGKSELAKKAQRVLDEFLNRTGWSMLEQEAVFRCDRDGECFIRLFHIGDGKTEVRFVEPEHVRDLSGQRERQFGIVTDPYDIHTILSYEVVERPWLNLDTVDVPADEIVHIKINTDSSAKRGLPTLYPVSKNLTRADQLLKNMSVLAATQATFAVIRKHKQYSASSISAFQQSQVNRTTSDPLTGQQIGTQRLKPGSIIDTTDNTEYEFPGSSVDASSLVAILQAELRAIAARLVMPEYMLTVDASNANYASTLVAEAPSTKNFERLQQHFARRFGDGRWCDSHHCSVLWRVLYNAVDYGQLPRESLDELEIQAEGPTIVARDKKQETDRAKTLNESGVLSKHTWSKWEGLDREQEETQIAGEAPPAPMPGMGGGQPPMERPKSSPLSPKLQESADWDENAHERDDSGRFGSGNASLDKAETHHRDTGAGARQTKARGDSNSAHKAYSEGSGKASAAIDAAKEHVASVTEPYEGVEGRLKEAGLTAEEMAPVAKAKERQGATLQKRHAAYVEKVHAVEQAKLAVDQLKKAEPAEPPAAPEPPEEPAEPDYPEEPDEGTPEHDEWKKSVDKLDSNYSQAMKGHEKAVEEWEKKSADHDKATEKWEKDHERWSDKVDRADEKQSAAEEKLDEAHDKLSEAVDDYDEKMTAAVDKAIESGRERMQEPEDEEREDDGHKANK